MLRLARYVAASALTFSACAESPLQPGNVADVSNCIKEAQKKFVRVSMGIYAYECFTDDDFREFKVDKVPQKVAEALRANRRFMEGVIALRAKPEAEREALIKACRRPLRPTWAELGRISPEGQTEAGNAAELDIAKAVADLVEQLVKLPDAKIAELYENR